MNLIDLKSFLAVVELHSISLAAKKMHISQPALTKRIKKIEAELNVQLFNSSGLRTKLTPKGKELLPYIRQMIHLNNELLKSTTNETKQPQLLINVGVSTYVAKIIIPEFLAYLNHLELNYFINTIMIAEKDLVKGLNDGNCDLIISPTSRKELANISSIPLWKEKIRVIVNNTHPLAAKQKEYSLAELAQFDAVLLEKNILLRRIIDEVVEQQKIPLKVLSESNMIDNNISLVEKGMGWSIVCEGLLKPNLVALNISDFSPTIEFHCHYLKKRADERLIWVFVEHLRNWVAKQPE